MDSIILGNRIKTLLVIKDIKRKELAYRLHISYNSLTKKLKGDRDFTIKEIWKMQKIFGLDVNSYANTILNTNYELISLVKINK